MANGIARMLATLFELESLDARVVIVPLDGFGFTEGTNWLTDSKTFASYVSSGLKSNAGYFNVLITEGTSDNEREIISDIVALPDVVHTVCCVVEPDVYTWIDINRAKEKDATSKKLNPNWISHWRKMGNLGISQAIKKIQDDTKFSVRLWSELPVTSLAVGYHSYSLIEKGWFPGDDIHGDDYISVVYPASNNDDRVISRPFIGGDNGNYMVTKEKRGDKDAIVLHIYHSEASVLAALVSQQIDEIHVTNGGGYPMYAIKILEQAFLRNIPVHVNSVASAGNFYAAYAKCIFNEGFRASGHFFYKDTAFSAVNCWFNETPAYFLNNSYLFDMSRVKRYIDSMRIFSSDVLRYCAGKDNLNRAGDFYLDITYCFSEVRNNFGGSSCEEYFYTENAKSVLKLPYWFLCEFAEFVSEPDRSESKILEFFDCIGIIFLSDELDLQMPWNDKYIRTKLDSFFLSCDTGVLNSVAEKWMDSQIERKRGIIRMDLLIDDFHLFPIFQSFVSHIITRRITRAKYTEI